MTNPLHSEPPEVLQLAGHPVRWRLLAALARSDRMVSELTGIVGEPQNLVSYHLGKLREGRLVNARRSQADRRDTYYGLDLGVVSDALSGVGGALHPGLTMGAGWTVSVADLRAAGPQRVLFLCSGNSARSQMAEALLRALSGGAVAAVSAGSAPKPLHPNAVRAMAETFGIDIAGQAPKHFDTLAGQDFDWVISLCDKVREVCPEFPGDPETIHWSLPNPATDEPDSVTYPAFQATAAELAQRVGFLLAAMATPQPLGGDHGRGQ